MSAMNLGEIRSQTADPSGLARIQQLEATSELDSFVYVVSHDLRNSARALTEVPQWLSEDLKAQGVKFSSDVQENFDLLDRHAKRLDRMLLDLLVYSRVGRMHSVSEFSLASLIEDVLSESLVPDRVRVELVGDLPALCMGYKDAFVMVKSVIDNVVRHCSDAPTCLTISGKRRRDQVTLTFTDDGPGVPNTDLQRIFRPMTTLFRRDEREGSGMGLAIIQRIVTHYGGEVWAGTGPDGSGLRLRLRMRDAEPTPVSAVANQASDPI